MKQTAQQIAELVHGKLMGRGDVLLSSVASLKSAGSEDLSYAEEKFQTDAVRSQAGCSGEPSSRERAR
jgi:UDP-3-O-[3-hydroxymyristoyl] glucosamine N-acyltransferase